MAKSLKVQYKEYKKNPYFDKRGWFIEMVKHSEIKLPIKQVSVASIKPGQVRGNHYHNDKTEWFFVIGGKAEFYLGDPFKNIVKKIILSGKNPKVINVLPKVAHAVKNISKKTIYFVEVDSAEYKHKKPDAIPTIICK